MREDGRAERRAEIRAAAYRLLKEQGYQRTSMLAVAKAAKASNETLYRWYGDKRGLFRTLAEENAAEIRQALETAIRDRADPLASLEAVAPVLLSMLLGEGPIALNRAAAADESGDLGAAIAQGGRTAIVPLIETLIRRGIDTGAFHLSDPREGAEWFVALLVGDLQIRRATGVIPEPDPNFIARRVASAAKAFGRLCGLPATGAKS